MKRLKVIISIIIIILAAMAIIAWQWLLVDLPKPDELYHHASAASTTIYDRHGTILYQITNPHQGHHTPLTLADIPQYCIEASIATEDATFYNNPGFDTWAMLRALITNVQEQQIVSGASTITQQLARNLLFTEAERTEVSITRKLREVILAWRLTQTYNKDEILTLYLNETYFGNLAYGLEAASNIYFGKQTAELDLAECALLAGLPQSPAVYNPLENLPAAKTRQQDVLALMVKHNFLSEDEAALASKEILQFAAIPFPIQAPHFVMYIRGQLEREFGLEAIYTQGLQVHTTLDLAMQNETRRITQYHLAELAKPEGSLPPRNVHNAAVIIMHPYTGEVFTMLGSPNYFEASIDGNVNATVASRQPGSSIKPLTYAAAFDPQLAKRYGYAPLTAATMMMDVRTAFVTKEGHPYVPQNYDRRWHGPVLLREALASSFNLIAVKVLEHIGLDTLIDLGRQLGISTFNEADRFGLALTLGGGEVKLLELTAAYAALSNGGSKIEPITILTVSNAKGDILYQRQPSKGEQVLTPQAAYLITNILSDNLARAGAFGVGSPLHLSRPAAAKTGTTTDFRDNWTIGYTTQFVTGVWAGNADNEPMKHISGVTGAGPIWHDVMEAIHKDLPVQAFRQPDGLSTQTICSINGLIPSAGCQYTKEELFINGTQVNNRDTWHKQLTIDQRNGLLAGPNCPAEYTRKRWYTIYPIEAEPWVEKNITRQVPSLYSPLCPIPEQALTEAQIALLNASLAQTNQQTVATTPIRFISPDQGSIYQLSTTMPADKQKIKIAVQLAADINPKSVQLYVNGNLLTTETQTLWQLTPGNYVFEAIGTKINGDVVRERVEITVE